MKKRFWLIGAVVLIAAAVAAILIVPSPASEQTLTEPATTEARSIVLADAASVYRQALDEFLYNKNATLTVTSSVSMIAAGSVFKEETTQTVYYQKLSNDNMRAGVLATVRMGDYSFDTAHYYTGKNAYLILNETAFSSPMTAEEFQSSYIPAVMIDPSHYGSITGIDTGEFTSVIFHQPKEPEAWAAESDAVLVSGNASAILDADRKLTESTYEITYTLGGATIRKAVHMQIQTTQDVELPALTDSTPVENLNALTALERACGYLLQADVIGSESKEAIFCEAFGDDRNQTVAMYMHGKDDTYAADITTTVSLYNSSRGGEVTNISQALQFRSGIATLSENGAAAVERPDITGAVMRKHCRNMLISTVLLPDYICAATVTETEDAYVYHFEANAQMSELMCENICTILYQTPELLDAMASGHTDLVMNGSLTIDKQTGFPLSSGIRYESSHTIKDFPYALRYETEQTYNFPNA